MNIISLLPRRSSFLQFLQRFRRIEIGPDRLFEFVEPGDPFDHSSPVLVKPPSDLSCGVVPFPRGRWSLLRNDRRLSSRELPDPRLGPFGFRFKGSNLASAVL